MFTLGQYYSLRPHYASRFHSECRVLPPDDVLIAALRHARVDTVDLPARRRRDGRRRDETYEGAREWPSREDRVSFVYLIGVV